MYTHTHMYIPQSYDLIELNKTEHGSYNEIIQKCLFLKIIFKLYIYI